jgi:hypothetical protein
LLDFLVLQHAECFAREILAVDFLWIKNVAQFIAGETVETGVVGIQLGAELGAADFLPAEGFAVVVHVSGEETRVVGGAD